MQQPRYQQIAQQLREDMLAGKYPENAQIPPENELASLMGVSRPTVRQALNLLEQEGRLIRMASRHPMEIPLMSAAIAVRICRP